MIRHILPLAAAATLAACASTPAPPSAIEVTRFHDSAALAAKSQAAVFVETAPGSQIDGLALAPYKSAVAAELARLGFTERDRAQSALVAQIAAERFTVSPQQRSGPVSVGVGGSTGSYGSGVGVGLGINLGGSGPRERVGTKLTLMLRDAATGQAIWEGRSEFTVDAEAELAAASRHANILAEAMLRDFPGGNGETIEIEVE